MAEQPQARKQHPVPQEVFGIKFRLVGDLTVRQFGILAIFGLFAFVFFSSGIFLPFRILLTLIFTLGGIAFAFVPVQDMPLDQWIGAFFRAIYSPTRRIWIKTAEAPDFLTLEIPKFAPTPEPGVTAEESRRKLSAFIAGVRGEEELSPLDLEEKQYLEGIRTMARQVSPAPAPAPAVAVAEVPAEPSGPPIEVPGARISPEVEEEVEAPPPPTPSGVLPELRFVEVQRLQKRPSLASRVNWGEQVFKAQRGEESIYFSPRRNVRVGRRLTPLAIAGAEVYAPVKERTIEPEVPGAPELPPISQQAPSPPAPPVKAPPAPPPPPAPKAPSPPSTVLPEEFKPEARVVEEKPAPPAPPAPPPPTEEAPPKAEAPPAAPPPAPKAEPPKLAPKPMPKLEAKKPAQIGEQPNAISGNVHDKSGGILSQTLLTIKDQKGNVVRATKTNELGRFSTAPLPNGRYTIELPKAPVPFATMKVELTGEKVEELEIRPKG